MSVNKPYKLLSLVSLCLPEEDELKRYVIIALITGSSEYAELRDSKGFIHVFKEHLAPKILSLYDLKKLGEVTHAVRILPSVLSELKQSIHNGNGHKLSSDDMPDFCDADQLKRLTHKLERGSKGQNLSNIGESEFMLLFHDTVIKSAEKVFLELPSESKCDSVDAIISAFPNSKFCISRDEILKMQRKMNDSSAEHTKKVAKQNETRVARILIKIAAAILLVATPLVMRMLGFLTHEWFIISEATLGAIAFLYIFLG